LVEDNPANQKLAAYVLQERGHTVEIAGDGSEGLSKACQSRYDLILMDLHMPGMNGLEAATAIRVREGRARRTPIIALTADAAKEDRHRCLASGMDGYLSKPIKAHEMIALVERMAAESALAEADAVSSPADRRTALKVVPSTEPAAAAADVVFDPALALRRCFNNPNMLRDMVQSFLADLDTQLRQMRAALERGDLADLGATAHRLKGTAVYLAAGPVTEAAACIERLEILGGGEAETRTALEALEQQCQFLKAALRAGIAAGG
jgi:CheY-like chemotaxis protein